MRSVFIVILCAVLVAGCLRITDGQGHDLRLKQSDAVGLSAERVVQVPVGDSKVLKAMVKGSIYETGEQVTVFGTCLDAYDMPVAGGTWATLSAWYPNGTLFFTNGTMTELQPGYYIAVSSMSAVQGTYMTELMCHVNGSDEIAKAWGEWQNPFWVRRIALLNDSLVNLSNSLNASIGNFSISLGQFESNVENSFLITWQNQNITDALINSSYQNITQQLTYVAMVANASVDRNDSYLAHMLQNLTSLVIGPLPGAAVNFTETADRPVYLKTWHISVQPNGLKGKLSYPEVLCTIVTNLPTNVMNMDVHGQGFDYSVLINRFGDFNWTVSCAYT
jgi:hypothetical protein